MIVQKDFIAKGAEASIFNGSFLQTSIILKHRLPKAYRLPQIDQRIRLHRLRAEARVMTTAWKIGVRVPVLLGIDSTNYTLIIEEIQGDILFSLIGDSSSTNLKSIFKKVGTQVGLLHKNNIIHGDLTVFNIILEKKKIPWLIDFGLGQISPEIESKAEDLLTFYSTLKAITPDHKLLFEAFHSGYFDTYAEGSKIFEQMKKIQSRARYIAREERII